MEKQLKRVHEEYAKSGFKKKKIVHEAYNYLQEFKRLHGNKLNKEVNFTCSSLATESKQITK